MSRVKNRIKKSLERKCVDYVPLPLDFIFFVGISHTDIGGWSVSAMTKLSGSSLNRLIARRLWKIFTVWGYFNYLKKVDNIQAVLTAAAAKVGKKIITQRRKKCKRLVCKNSTITAVVKSTITCKWLTDSENRKMLLRSCVRWRETRTGKSKKRKRKRGGLESRDGIRTPNSGNSSIE